MNMNEARTVELNQDLDLQYLTFELAGEEYGIDILSVQEIKGWSGVRHVPAMPDYVKGVLDLRGVLVPIMDLRLRFAMTNAEYTPTTVIIVISIRKDDGQQLLGLVVDAVSDVLEASPEEFKQPPNFGTDARARFMKGMVTSADRMVLVLNSEELLSGSEMDQLTQMAGEPRPVAAVG